jgi:hypothetical protein
MAGHPARRHRGVVTERTGPTRYEIEIGGHASDRVLRPVIDEFTIDFTQVGTTRLVGTIRDPSHLNGLLAHFTSLNVEVMALRRLDQTTGAMFPTNSSEPERNLP